jgi:hypothetical protein
VKLLSCENCIHWTRNNHPDLEESGFGTCDMMIVDVEPVGRSSRFIRNLITRAEYKCMSWEKKK